MLNYVNFYSSVSTYTKQWLPCNQIKNRLSWLPKITQQSEIAMPSQNFTNLSPCDKSNQ